MDTIVFETKRQEYVPWCNWMFHGMQQSWLVIALSFFLPM